MHLLLSAAFLLVAPFASGDTLVAPGATWKYLDDGSDQGMAWYATGFDDSAWASGPAQLGYGDGDEATVVGYGPDGQNKFVTTYFRHSFTAPSPSAYLSLDLKLLRDDGAVVYLNGAELVRSNMPAGAIDYLTLASGTIGGAAEDTFVRFVAPVTTLVAGTNVIAVEIHQRSGTSSDISLDLELTGVTSLEVVRGPYLQLGTTSGVVVRWRTNAPTDTKVDWGLDPGNLNQSVTVPGSRFEHEVELNGATADTVHYYAIGTSTQVLSSGTDHLFETPPLPGTKQKTRVWVLGDSGTADANAAAVRDAYYSWTGDTHTDLWLMLGDNAYDTGSDEEYQAAVFDTYPEMLRKSVLWPTRGNHERDAAVYYGIFTLPAAGEAGGVPSSTEAYWSFDHANVHFICLDSTGSDLSVGGEMFTWLQDDLAATTQDWIITYCHHPPYTKGSHNSNTESTLIEMRENIVPVLEDGGTDMLLCGHSHSYERSYLIDGHYGHSSTFDETMLRDGGDGRLDGTGAYQKRRASHQGSVYVVAGSSGKLTNGPLNHPAMFHSALLFGSVVLDFDDVELSVTFLDALGQVEDHFTLQKILFDANTLAAVSSRNAGANPESYSASMPRLGQLFTTTLDVGSTGHLGGEVFGYAAPANFSLGSGDVLLIDVTHPDGELLSQPLQGGPIAIHIQQIPLDGSLCGYRLSTQGVHLFGGQPLRLSNAQDLLLGL